MEDYDLNRENQRTIEKIVLIIYTIYHISMFVAAIERSWDNWVAFFLFTQLLSNWFVYISKCKDYRFRARFISIVMQIGMVLYAVNVEDLFSAIPIFIALVLLTGLYGMKENILITTISFIYLLFYHGVIIRTIHFTSTEETIWMLFQVANVFLIEGIVYVWVKTRNDRNEQLLKVIEILKEAERSKNDFLTNVSHEIRTPINTICGMSEIVQQEDNLQKVREDVFHIHNAGRNLMSIVSDILDFSELQSGKMEIAEEAYNITSTINDVINMSMAKKSEKNIELIVECDADIPCSLLGDEKKIRRVIMNLVNNAIKFTNEGYVSIVVSYRRESYGINLSVAVKDTGIGMSEESLEKLFTSFNQVDTKRNRQEGGIGLGLAISQALVRKMGGIITVRSKLGKGSNIKFVIPQKVLDERPVTHVENKEALNAAVYINMEQFEMLAIRDEYAGNIRKMIEQLEVKCHICRNLQELKRRVAREQFTHIFISYAEYQEDRNYFDGLAKDTNLVMVISESEERKLTNPDIIRVYKPLYILPIVAVLNNNRVWTGKGGRLVCHGRFTAPEAHILAVDDNAMNLMILEGLLYSYQIKVTSALSGREALEKIETMDYDFVFMDHMMPEMDGVEVLHRIRKKVGSYYQNVPIIALTANAVAGSREMFLAEGFSDFIEKPIEVSVLERVLRRNLPAQKLIFPESPESHESITEENTAEEPKPEKSGEDTPKKEEEFAIGNLDVGKGIVYCGGKEMYLKILRQYGMSGGETRQKVAELYEEENWKDYTIAVHAVKSSMLSIGAVRLSELAKQLEMAGKEGRTEEIRKNHDIMLAEYDRVMKLIKESPQVGLPQEEARSGKELPELDGEEFEMMIASMEEAMYDLNGDTMLELIEKLQKYQYCGASLQEELEPVKRKVEMTDYMSAVSLIEKKKKQLESSGKGGREEC